MSLFAKYPVCANWTQLNYRTLVLSSDSGAKWIRGYESLSSDCLANVDLIPLEFRQKKGMNSSFCDIEHTETRLESRRARTTRRPAQHTAAAPNFVSHTRGRHLRYLIGQQ